MALAELSLRPAREEDIAFLLELRRLTMVPHQIASGVVPSEVERRERVALHFEWARILEYQGLPVGLLKLVRLPPVWLLSQIQLLPTYQGRGWGRDLLEGILCEAQQAGVAVELHVLRENPARRLYERLGFVQTHVQANAYVMRWNPPKDG